jgi:hypothetical protein
MSKIVPDIKQTTQVTTLQALMKYTKNKPTLHWNLAETKQPWIVWQNKICFHEDTHAKKLYFVIEQASYPYKETKPSFGYFFSCHDSKINLLFRKIEGGNVLSCIV